MWRDAILFCLLFFTAAAAPPESGQYFKITVVDEATGRGVPLVELKTTSNVTVYTDSNGIIAWNEPGLMDRTVFFEVHSDGYRYPGQAVALKARRGGSAEIKLERVNVAERLYRITGQGIYRDSVLTGQATPLRNPVLNGEITGQDTALAVPYRGRIYWFWGDTNRVAGRFGHFGTAGATSELPAKGGLDPSAGVDPRYFVDATGFSKPMCGFPGPGMKWLFWAVSVTDEQGRERLAARYRSMKGLGESIEGGLALFNDEKETLERFAPFDDELDPRIAIHPFRVSSGGAEYFYFAGPLPDLRVRATLKQLADPSAYEGFTCLAAGSRYARADSKLDRAPDGRLVYSWKKNTLPLTFDQQKELVSAGKMKPEEGTFQLRDFLTDTPVQPHAGSVFWNAFRKRWVMIVQQNRGPSGNGEIWYAEADTPAGPWVYARKIVTHDRYTFYNPAQRPFFDQDGGRLIYFEGTYTSSFSSSPVKTPWYDYNQIMYRLALDDARLFLPVPVYRLKDGRYMLREQVAAAGAWDSIEEIPFFALPPGRQGAGAVPIGNLFYALPAVPGERMNPLAGRWSCREGGGFDFRLALRQSGNTVSGTLDGNTLTGADFRDNKLAFHVRLENESYQVTLEPRGGKLLGAWKGRTDGDSVTCELDDEAGRAKSAALVPLYAYRGQDGSVLYSTDPVYTDPRRKRSAEPVARVWRNPMRVLALDRDARAN